VVHLTRGPCSIPPPEREIAVDDRETSDTPDATVSLGSELPPFPFSPFLCRRSQTFNSTGNRRRRRLRSSTNNLCLSSSAGDRHLPLFFSSCLARQYLARGLTDELDTHTGSRLFPFFFFSRMVVSTFFLFLKLAAFHAEVICGRPGVWMFPNQLPRSLGSISFSPFFFFLPSALTGEKRTAPPAV